MTVELITERLLLRPYRLDDLQDLYALTADDEMRRYLEPTPPSLEDSYRRLLSVLGGWATLGYSTFAVIERASGAYVANCGVFPMVRSFDDGSVAKFDEAGWIVAGSRWGRGYAGEAMTAAHRWFDQSFGRRTHCMISPGNTASERLAARLGYRAIGETLHKGDACVLYTREPGGETS